MRRGTSRAKSRISRLIWTIAAVGISAGVITLVLNHLVLTQIREERLHTEQFHRELTHTLETFRSEREAVVHDIHGHLSLSQEKSHRTTSPSNRLAPLVERCLAIFAERHPKNTAFPKLIQQLRQVSQSLVSLHEESEQWQANAIQLAKEQEKAWDELKRANQKAMAAAEKLEGQQRLQRNLMIHRYRLAKGDQREKLAMAFIDQLSNEQTYATVKQELSKWLLLTERLHNESDLDQLVSLKDNQFRQTFTRLRHGVRQLESIHQENTSELIEAIKNAVFGKDSYADSIHQTLVTGSGGLYQIRHRYLASCHQLDRLRTETTQRLEDCLKVEAALDKMVGNLSTESANQNVATLRHAWKQSLGTGLIVGILFLLLAQRISKIGRKAEWELLASKQDLERMLVELKENEQKLQALALERQKTNAMLEQAMVAANEANQAKSAFLANMSHEIRTPLNGILGFAELLQNYWSEIDDQERQEHLNTITHSGKHLLELVNGVLDLSKVEAGGIEAEREPCSPQHIISDVVSMLRVKAQEKGLRLEFQWDGDIPETLMTDAALLRQILMNLVGNAIKFTDSGEVRIVASLDERHLPPQLVVEVKDSGIGIAEDKLETIFDPFVQADSSVTRRFGGTGLGLAISRKLARILGGNITATSVSGKGSVFRLTIDAGSLEGVARHSSSSFAACSAEVTQKEHAEPTRLPPARILLVEDGETNRKLIQLILNRAGVCVVTAENGQMGVDLATEQTFDLILMDMQMPVLDGYAATRALRATGMTLPIIALTAHAMKGDAEKCLAAGCSGFLTKPIESGTLLRTVADALTNSTRHQNEFDVSSTTPLQTQVTNMTPIRSTLPIDDDPEFQEIVDDFVKRLHEQLDAMHAALADKDFDRLARLAHWLKGSGGTAGFPMLTEPAAILESLAKNGQAESIPLKLNEIAALATRIDVASVSHS